MSSNPSEFAQRVLNAFEEAGHATDEEVGNADGPSTTTLAKYRKVAAGEMTMGEPRGDVMKRIDQAAKWEPGSARALWRQGRAPEPATRTVSSVAAQLGVSASRRTGRGGVDGFLDNMADRLTEVEERLDLITAKLEELSAPPFNLRSVAKPGGLEPEDGDLNEP